MELKNYSTYFLFLLLGAGGILVFFIFKPFLTAILAAAILAVIFRKPYKFLYGLTGKRKGVSSFLTCILIALAIVTPVVTVSTLLVNEANDIYKSVSTEGSAYRSHIENTFIYFGNLPFLQPFDVDKILSQENFFNSLKNLSQWLMVIAQKTYQSVIGTFFWIFIMFFSLFYLLIDGREIINKIMHFSPLKDSQEELLLEKFISISRATLKGTLIIGIIQGILGGVTFAAVGVPSVIILTFAMIVLSIIPMLGAGLVWFPVGIGMMIAGNIWQGIVILAVGFGVISVIDNLLRPKLVGRDTQMHPLLIFFSTLGGIALFGIIGFVIGPVIMAFFMTLLDIYSVEFKRQLRVYNKT